MKHIQDSENAKLDAEANWYGVRLEKRLQMVKDVKLDFTKCMLDYELEEWQLEQAEAGSRIFCYHAFDELCSWLFSYV